jgi:(p)ppGpp synthase/HD superfamily hydrolase
MAERTLDRPSHRFFRGARRRGAHSRGAAAEGHRHPLHRPPARRHEHRARVRATEDEAIAAVLHDVIEDIPEPFGANWAQRWIRFAFGPDVLAIVEGCTDSDRTPKPPWRERKTAYVRHVAAAPMSVGR